MPKRKGGRPPASQRGIVFWESVEAIVRLEKDLGRPPTTRELQRDFGVGSVATVIERLKTLYKHGLVYYEIGSRGTLMVTPKGMELYASRRRDG